MRSTSCVIAIHGGAGATRLSLGKKDEAQHLAELKRALKHAYKLLSSGATAVDAVEAAVRSLEDCPLFNAGKGAVFTADGTHELDAAIMDGQSLAAGAVAGIGNAKNPVSVARLVMEKTRHVLLAGKGAEAFAAEQGADLVSSEYFYVEKRWLEFLNARKRDTVTLDHEIALAPSKKSEKFGTVGAVARDSFSNIAAATSTGGMTNKMPGRVGDSPVFGAGTYADNGTVAVSCTGRGEEFIRHMVAHSIAARIKFNKESLATASRNVLKLLPKNCGGIIAVNAKGQIAMPFNTEGMFRGSVDKNGTVTVSCF